MIDANGRRETFASLAFVIATSVLKGLVGVAPLVLAMYYFRDDLVVLAELASRKFGW